MRAIVSKGDFQYWRYHLAHEHERVHPSRYASTVTVPRHLALTA
jgi:hypothetical protein